jgi:hypothetical protein
MRGLAKVETPGIQMDLLDDDICKDLMDACKLFMIIKLCIIYVKGILLEVSSSMDMVLEPY